LPKNDGIFHLFQQAERVVDGSDSGDQKAVSRSVRFGSLLTTMIGPPAVACVFLCIIGLFSRWSWLYITELSSHFYLQYGILFLIFFLCAALAKRRDLMIIMLPCIAICIMQLLPIYLTPPAANTDNLPRLTVLQANLNASNKHHDKVIEMIMNSGADVVCCEEVNKQWWVDLQNSLRQIYPYSNGLAREDNFGLVMFSRHPFEKTQVVDFGSVGTPSIVSTISFHDKPITVRTRSSRRAQHANGKHYRDAPKIWRAIDPGG
jgi:endonuclease/exonuclease/phosphatase (EEP) superfamily protein YafD